MNDPRTSNPSRKRTMRKDTRTSDSATQIQPDACGDAQTSTRKNRKAEINWSEWWPFERATGTALRQLNKRQPKPEYEDAPI